MTTQPEALRLSDWLDKGGWPSYVPQESAAELRRQHARITELEQQLVTESARTAAEKLRADQMTEQHRMQSAMREQLEQQLAARCLHKIEEPSAPNVEPIIEMLQNALANTHAKHGSDFRYVELPACAAEMICQLISLMPELIKQGLKMEKTLKNISANTSCAWAQGVADRAILDTQEPQQ